MNLWMDIEREEIVTEALLLEEFRNLQAESADYADITFAEYIGNCLTSAGGTLEALKSGSRIPA